MTDARAEARDGALILGIDPGTAATGFGVVRRDADLRVTLVECGVIRTSSKEALPIRIREIYDGIVALIERHRPDAVSVEEVFHGKNAQSALKLGHARGAILLAAAHHDLMIAEYAPRQIKKAVVGTGNATKDQVGFMVKQQLRLLRSSAQHHLFCTDRRDQISLVWAREINWERSLLRLFKYLCCQNMRDVSIFNENDWWAACFTGEETSFPIGRTFNLFFG